MLKKISYQQYKWVYQWYIMYFQKRHPRGRVISAPSFGPGGPLVQILLEAQFIS